MLNNDNISDYVLLMKDVIEFLQTPLYINFFYEKKAHIQASQEMHHQTFLRETHGRRCALIGPHQAKVRPHNYKEYEPDSVLSYQRRIEN